MCLASVPWAETVPCLFTQCWAWGHCHFLFLSCSFFFFYFNLASSTAFSLEPLEKNEKPVGVVCVCGVLFHMIEWKYKRKQNVAPVGFPPKPAWQIKKEAGGRTKPSHETAFSDPTQEECDFSLAVKGAISLGPHYPDLRWTLFWKVFYPFKLRWNWFKGRTIQSIGCIVSLEAGVISLSLPSANMNTALHPPAPRIAFIFYVTCKTFTGPPWKLIRKSQEYLLLSSAVYTVHGSGTFCILNPGFDQHPLLVGANSSPLSCIITAAPLSSILASFLASSSNPFSE